MYRCVSLETRKTGHERTKFLRALAEAGYEDSLVLRRETAERVMSDERARIIEELRDGDVRSIRELARRTDRDAGAVKRDLDVLFECDVIEYSEHGARKAPRLKYDNVFVEPLLVR
jgi:predicted transcriptional regulator